MYRFKIGIILKDRVVIEPAQIIITILCWNLWGLQMINHRRPKSMSGQLCSQTTKNGGNLQGNIRKNGNLS